MWRTRRSPQARWVGAGRAAQRASSAEMEARRSSSSRRPSGAPTAPARTRAQPGDKPAGRAMVAIHSAKRAAASAREPNLKKGKKCFEMRARRWRGARGAVCNVSTEGRCLASARPRIARTCTHADSTHLMFSSQRAVTGAAGGVDGRAAAARQRWPALARRRRHAPARRGVGCAQTGPHTGRGGATEGEGSGAAAPLATARGPPRRRGEGEDNMFFEARK